MWAILPSPAWAQYATGGSGRFRNNIIWFDWGIHGDPIPDAGLTVSNSYPVAGESLDVTCTLSNIVKIAGGGVAPFLGVYRPGNYFQDGLDALYNIGGAHLRRRPEPGGAEGGVHGV